MDYFLPTSVEINGEEYAIQTDFRVILGIIGLFDEDMTDAEKAAGILMLFYDDYEKITDYQTAIDKCLEFIDMDTGKNSGKKSPRLMDWKHDWKYIVAPVNRILGYECRACDYLHWWTFLGAYQEIGDCVFTQIINIRDKTARGTRLEKYEREWARKNSSMIKLPPKYTQQQKEMFRKLGV